MSKMKQKDAVFQAILNVTGFAGEGKCAPTKEQRAQISAILVEGLKSGSIELSREYSESDLKGYVSGLLSNWLRKDVRFNEGMKYVPKSPGSRQGSSDPQLKALKQLMTTDITDAEREEIQGYIDARMKEINATKVAKTVDFSALPAELAAKFQK